MVSLELSILTLNVWGIPLISSDRHTRMKAIGNELNSGKYDIVSLQEVWTEKDSQLLQEMTKSMLPFAHYFYSGVIGAGLLVLSKYPIISTLFHAWTVNGYCHRIQHADWFGGKGVGMCRIRVGDQYIHLYNAHLHAEYNINNDEYISHRVIQAFDTAQFIEATQLDSAVQVLAGDLNTKPKDISYKVLLHTSGMTDSCNSDSIATNEGKHNSYTSKKALVKNPNGFRIDHIFLRSGRRTKTSIVEYKLPLPDRVPGQKYSYSDHEAVQVILRLEKKHNADGDGFDDSCSINHINGCISDAEADGCSMQDVDLTTTQHETISTANGKSSNSLPEEVNEGDCPAPVTSTFATKLPKNLAIIKEAIDICDKHLKRLKTDRIIYFTISIILLAALVVMAVFPVPKGYMSLYLLLKLLVFAIILFCTFMGSIWNLMERNGTLSGKTSMEMKLKGAQLFDMKSD